MRLLLITALLGLFGVTAAAADASRPFAAFDKAGPPVLNDPHDLAFGPDGRLYVADKFGHRIAVLDPETLDIVETIDAGKLPGVHDISIGPDGRAAVAVTGLSAVIVYDSIHTKNRKPVAALAASRTEGALLHSNGRIYAMAGGTGTVVAVEGKKVVATADGHFGAHDVAEDKEGNIWVADNFQRRLVKYSPDLKQLQVINAAKYGFVGPRYLAFDGFGRMVVADQDAHRILLIDPNGPDGGTLLGTLGDGIPGKGPNKFDDPEGVVVKDNFFYIADSDNNRVVRYTIAIN